MARTKRQPKPLVAPIQANPDLMRFLSNFYSRSQLQIRLEEHLAGLPPEMPVIERTMRIAAIEQLGIKRSTKLRLDEES